MLTVRNVLRDGHHRDGHRVPAANRADRSMHREVTARVVPHPELTGPVPAMPECFCDLLNGRPLPWRLSSADNTEISDPHPQRVPRVEPVEPLRRAVPVRNPPPLIHANNRLPNFIQQQRLHNQIIMMLPSH
ncbi:hypothetical protein D9M72_537120 [compost metagenome]